jgi:hypothetical protein
MKTYIVRFKDGALMPTRTKPYPSHFAEGSEFWLVDENVKLPDIQDWMAAIRAHDCKVSKCAPVCTFGDW